MREFSKKKKTANYLEFLNDNYDQKSLQQNQLVALLQMLPVVMMNLTNGTNTSTTTTTTSQNLTGGTPPPNGTGVTPPPSQILTGDIKSASTNYDDDEPIICRPFPEQSDSSSDHITKRLENVHLKKPKKNKKNQN